jgi:uncharacterized protein (TIGR02466 family)
MQKAVSFMFPTPVGEFRIPESEPTDQRLKQLILAREQSDPGENYANAGGWHSKSDLLDWSDPAIGALRRWMMEAVHSMIDATLQQMKSAGMRTTVKGGVLQAKAWANVSRYGNYHRSHNHPSAAWSGVYYVDPGLDAPEHPLSGLLELPDPRPYANMINTPGDPFGQKALIKPEAGLMVLFPSWFPHFVHPYYAEGTRISVAFNVSVVEDPPKA